jgi:hypothetical protein
MNLQNTRRFHFIGYSHEEFSILDYYKLKLSVHQIWKAVMLFISSLYFLFVQSSAPVGPLIGHFWIL